MLKALTGRRWITLQILLDPKLDQFEPKRDSMVSNIRTQIQNCKDADLRSRTFLCKHLNETFLKFLACNVV